MVGVSLEIERVFRILYFPNKENHFFIEIGWGKKIKNPSWEWIAIDLRQLQLIIFSLNLLSLKHFLLIFFHFLGFLLLCEVCSFLSHSFY